MVNHRSYDFSEEALYGILRLEGYTDKDWERYGDEAVKNVVDVTLLERLSDDEAVWLSFGKYISDDFKEYINEELLKDNIAMFHVGKLL